MGRCHLIILFSFLSIIKVRDITNTAEITDKKNPPYTVISVCVIIPKIPAIKNSTIDIPTEFLPSRSAFIYSPSFDLIEQEINRKDNAR